MRARLLSLLVAVTANGAPAQGNSETLALHSSSYSNMRQLPNGGHAGFEDKRTCKA